MVSWRSNRCANHKSQWSDEEMMKTMLPRSAAVAALGLAFLMLAGFMATAAADSTGFQWQYDAGNKQVTVTTPKLDIRVTTGGQVPHFMFWDPTILDPNARLTYHVQFHQLIEFDDTNADGVYTNGTDTNVRVLAMSAINWTFSGFLVDQVNGSVTAIHFNFTLADVQPPHGYEELFVQLRCHVNASKPEELKFDVVISGWPWANSGTYLALRWDLMVQSPGAGAYRHASQYQYHVENRTYSFDGAYVSYRSTANVGLSTIPVNSSISEQSDRTRFYIVYPNFGNQTLEHDPEVGLEDTTVVEPPVVPLLLVVGAGALACGVIAAAVLVRRRR